MRNAGFAARRFRPLLALLLSAFCFAWSLQYVMAQRHQVRKLTRAMDGIQIENRALHDELRSLSLEYLTLTDYETLRAVATELEMREPEIRDGSLVFVGGKS